MNTIRLQLKDAINKLCTLRCENLRMIMEGEDYSAKEKEVEAQERVVNDLLDKVQ